MYRALTEQRAGRPAEPLLGPFSRVLGISDVVPKDPGLLSVPDMNPEQQLATKPSNDCRRYQDSQRQEGPSVQLQAGKARSAVQVQDVPAEEMIAVQIRAR